MTKLNFLAAMILALPMVAFAATENEAPAPEHFRAINPAIDSWSAGVVSETDAKTGSLTVHGRSLPYASAHAQMRQELGAKLAGIDDKAQRRQIATQVHKDWADRLQAAMKQEAGDEKDFTFKQPADVKDVVILNGSDVRELTFFQKRAAERKEKMQGGEAAALEAALTDALVAGKDDSQPTSFKPEVREKAGEMREKKIEAASEKVEKVAEAAKEKALAMTPEEKAKAHEKLEAAKAKAKERIVAGREKLDAERLSLSDLKKGDKVLVGFDKDTGSYFSVIRRDIERMPQPVSAPQEPATVK